MGIELQYFKQEEFKGWWDQMSPALLRNLDQLRDNWGRPIIISPAKGAIGRTDTSTGQHNFYKWGEVRAVDVLPIGITHQSDVAKFRSLAEDACFTGIGFYPHWKPRPGFHLDVRVPVEEKYVAQWGGIRTEGGQQYVSFERAVREIHSVV